MNRLDESRRAAHVVQRLANLRYCHLQHSFGNMGVGPDRVQEVVLGHQLPGALCQKMQHRVSFGGKRNGFSILPQLLVGGIERERWKDDLLRFRHESCTIVSSLSSDAKTMRCRDLEFEKAMKRRLWLVLIAGAVIELSRGYFEPQLQALPSAPAGWTRTADGTLGRSVPGPMAFAKAGTSV